MIHVLESGRLTTLQDRGRIGFGHLGVPRAGASDYLSLRIANRLVGNPDDAVGLEMTVVGPRLEFQQDTFAALAGAHVEATLDRQPVAMYQTFHIPAGAVLRIGPVSRGARAYLAVAGGIEASCVLGSGSCDTFSALGPPPLVAGTRLSVGQRSTADAPGYYLRSPPSFTEEVTLRVVWGPHDDRFTAAARERFVSESFSPGDRQDRTGVRFESPALEQRGAGELPSAGMPNGAIQVPGDGRPIALLSNHGTTGGYPVIATVITADTGKLAQLVRGNRVRFLPVTRSEALEALREQERRLRSDILTADAMLLSARALMWLARGHASLRETTLSDSERKIRIRR